VHLRACVRITDVERGSVVYLSLKCVSSGLSAAWFLDTSPLCADILVGDALETWRPERRSSIDPAGIASNRSFAIRSNATPGSAHRAGG